MKTATITTGVLALAIALTVLVIMTTQTAYADPDCNVAPTNLSAALNGDSTAVVLTWTAPEDCTPDNYAVYRRVRSQEARLRKIDTVDGSATAYTDLNPQAGAAHRYRIKSNGNPPNSDYAEITVPEATPEPTPEPTPAPTPEPGIDYDEERNAAVSLGDITFQDGAIFRSGSVDGATDQVNYYEFELTVTRQVGLGLRRQDANGDLYLEDDEGTVLHSSEAAGDANEWIQENVNAGTYYIRVEAQESGSNQYKLRYGVKPATQQQTTPENTTATGAPSITGTVQVHETLTADTSNIADANGLSNATFAYQWIRGSGGTDTDISGSGATVSTYTLTDDDLGKTIKVRVSFTDDDGYAETLTSAATGAVSRPPNEAATGQPAITGTVEVGEALTAGTSGISDGNGTTNVQYAYQWIRGSGGTDTDISGATGSTYTLADDDLAKTIRVRVSFTDDDGYTETLTSNATNLLNRPPNATASGQPTIKGTVEVGETLTADTSDIADANGLSNATYAYQWVRSSGGTDTDTSGATGATYTLADEDAGNAVKVRVSFTDDDGYTETLTSNATDIVLVAQQQQQSETDTELECIEWINLSGRRIQISAMASSNAPPGTGWSPFPPTKNM